MRLSVVLIKTSRMVSMKGTNMEFFIFNVLLLLFTYQFDGALAKRHSEDHDDSYDEDDPNGLSDHCIHIRIDHDTRYTDYLICPFGCCGTLNDQKCCEDPEKANKEGLGNVHLVRGLLIFAGVMLIVALSCCVFGIYKHKKSKLRKTRPEGSTEVRRRPRSERSAPYAVYYTPRSGVRTGDDTKDRPKSQNQSGGRAASTNDRTSPPRYTEKYETGAELPPYPTQGPPPPYSFGLVSTAPEATEIRIEN